MRILDFADGFESSSAPTSVPYPATLVSVTPTGNISSVNAQAALQEIQGDVDTLNAKIGTANGIAPTGSDNKIPASYLPSIGIVTVQIVANIAARDALTVESGDIVQVTDAGSGVTKTYAYTGTTWVDIHSDAALTAHMQSSSAHAASSITNTASGNLASTNVQSSLVELQLDIDTRATSAALTAHTGDTANPHAVTKSQVGLSNVDNTSDATKNAAAVTLTNKSLDDTTSAVVDTADATKKIKFDAGGTTGTTTTITGAQTANRVVTLPDASTTLVGRDTTETLTNKVLSAASNTISNIVDACISASAAIGLSKLAALTASRALVSDGSGVISASSVTSTELSYLSGVTSALQAQINAISSSSAPTGMVVPYVGSTAPTSWLILNGNTIGNASSGATARANADTSALFTALWNDWSNTLLPIQDSTGAASTRGASASADFSANKRLPLPDVRGLFIRAVGSQTISSITYTGTLGNKQGDQMQGHVHQYTLNSLGAYSSTSPVAHNENWYTYSSTTANAGNPISDGSNGTPRTGSETRPANISMNYIVKL